MRIFHTLIPEIVVAVVSSGLAVVSAGLAVVAVVSRPDCGSCSE